MPGTTAVEDAALLRAVDLARRGPVAGPNPRVGCVLLDSSGDVIAEGWHRGAGTPHAEAAALAAVPEDRLDRLAGATAVVSLEPCGHAGRTPPCAEALLGAGIGRVVYGVPDPNPAAGGGAAWLTERGVDVALAAGPGAAAAADLLEPWLAAVSRGRPWVIGKTACSLDGRVTAADGTSRWITSRASREHAHEVRATVDAVVVGTGTVLADDPELTARRPDGSLAPHQPWRVVVGHRAVPHRARLHGPGGSLVHLRTHDLAGALAELGRQEVRTVLLEGGPTLLTAALTAGLVDELHAYVAPLLLGAGRHAVGDLGVRTLPGAVRWSTRSVERLGDDVHVVLRPAAGRAGPPGGC
jgi:diaminohydroxyphosphoribosylaminopyrimidine deaminase/5-amino-6-(5-phosphoribosylamino)uracil reductase